MTAAEWVRDLAGRSVELWVEGDRLRFRAPKGAIGAAERAELSARRDEVLAHLRAEASAHATTLQLSLSQQSLWFLHQQAPKSTAYHVALPVRVLSHIDVAALRHALQALVDRHASLRTTYAFASGAPWQRVAGAAAVAFTLVDLSAASEAARREAVESDYRHPFDLERGPVLRATLFRHGPEDHVLLVTVHHIAADGWSLMLLLDELARLYAEATGGPPANLLRPPVSYADYTTWQEQVLAGPEGERLWAYWRAKLSPPPAPLQLPTDRPRPLVQGFRGASLPLRLEPGLTATLKKLARQEGTTMFVLLLATFQAFLYRLTGCEDVVVGTPTFSRSRPEFMGVVGDFVNSVPLRARLRAATTFREFVAQTRQTVLEALDAQEFPLPLLVRRLQPDRDASRSPLFDTFFLLQRFDQFKHLEALLTGDEGGSPVSIGGLRLAAFPLPQQEGQFDLALQMLEREGVLHGVFKYATDLFDEATVGRFAADYVALVEALARDPALALGALPQSGAARVGAAPTPSALLERLRRRDVRLSLEGDELRVNAPRGALDDESKAAITARHGELVAALRAGNGGTGTARNGEPQYLSRAGGALPLSSAQHRLWFLDRIDPGRPNYVGGCARFHGPLDVPLLRRALDELVRRHESLRTRIGEREGEPYAEILAPAPAALEVVDISAQPAEARDAEARRRAEEWLPSSVDLAQGRLAAYLLVRRAPDDHELTMGLHPVISDAWSVVIALRDVCELYDALAGGRAPSLPALPLQYADYAAGEGERLRSGGTAALLAYWRGQLAGAPAVLELPTDRPRPAAQSFRTRRVQRHFSDGLFEAVEALSRRQDATPYMTLLAAFQVLLHRYSGQDEIVVGSRIANRDRAEFENLVGCFANDLVMRGRLSGNPSFAEFLAQVRRTTLAAFDHGDLPFHVLVEGLRPERSASHAPLFQVLFSFPSLPTDHAAPAGLQVELGELIDIGTARFDLALDVAHVAGRPAVSYEYATDLFDPETIERMHEHFEKLLGAIASDPTRRIEELPLLGEEERRRLAQWHETSLEHDRARCVHQLLEATARRSPDAPAVVCGREVLTYRALDERANRLARLLARRGVTPGSLVAVCVDRDFDMPTAIAAVLKAGAAYVPLDPTHPAERLRYTLEDAGIACAITLARFAPLLQGARVPVLLLDEAEAALAELPPTPPEVPVRPEDRAYVMYTSGSTGRPKGVEVEHRNVVSFLEAMQREPGFTAGDVLLAVTTLSFDIAGLEMWLPLSVGARVVVARRAEVIDGGRLMALLEEHGITVMQATPATWRLLLDAGWTGKRDLKVLCGGEALARDLAAALLARVGELWNVYGPTETTIWSTVTRIDDAAGAMTIGRPIHNTRVYVLERAGLEAPIGIPGELCIAGEGVARGYHDRPELTAERFVSLTLADGSHDRAYRTGDVARFRADGRLEFLGRRDHQVKIRGFRIELGEIETVLAADPAVKQAVVAARQIAPGDVRLVAYVVYRPGEDLTVSEVRRHLRRQLPEYMIPSAVLTLDAVPLTPNGKVDRAALPDPFAGAARTGAAHVPPAAGLEQVMAEIWREALRVDSVGAEDNFFELGGHSLLTLRVAAVVEERLGWRMDPRTLFFQNLRQVAAAASAARGPHAGS